jgi:hypothetical protein
LNNFVKENLIKSKLSILEKLGLGPGIIEKKGMGEFQR